MNIENMREKFESIPKIKSLIDQGAYWNEVEKNYDADDNAVVSLYSLHYLDGAWFVFLHTYTGRLDPIVK